MSPGTVPRRSGGGPRVSVVVRGAQAGIGVDEERRQAERQPATERIHMLRSRHELRWAVASLLLSLAACGAAPEDEWRASALSDAAPALNRLRARTGGDVTMQLGSTGLTRALAMSSRFPVTGLGADPAAAAIQFLADHGDAFQLDKSEVSSFTVVRVDDSGRGRGRHVVLQRLVDGDPVFGGEISVHLNNRNEIFSASAGDAYKVTSPSNRKILAPIEAGRAAGRALG